MKAWFKNLPYKKIALVLSLCALIAWSLLGTGASLAWFKDTSPELNNIFHFAEFDLEVSHQLTDGKWEVVNDQTELFDKEALYEPGYVQVVYLRVENKGDVPFNFYTAVNVNGYTTATNLFGQAFNLQDHLRFGITVSETVEAMKNSVATREVAKTVADKKLHNYETETAVLQPKQACYIALVVRMPENVGNIANYRSDKPPVVELGLTVKAEQLKNP